MSVAAMPARAATARLGMWLFLASEAMLFGSMFSGYALLRAGAPGWPSAQGMLSLPLALVQTSLLIAALACVRPTRGLLRLSTVFSMLFVGGKLIEYNVKIAAGMTPASNLLLASWFTLTGMHVAHVMGGALVTAWLAGPGWSSPEGDPDRLTRRIAVTRLYWMFVDLVWLAILVSFYLV